MPAASVPPTGLASTIGVGTWAWGNQLLWGYRADQDDPVLGATFDRAVAAGLRLFDTADSYGTGRLQGRSEELLGRFSDRCSPGTASELVLATKLAPFPWRWGRQGLRRAFEASRRRLRGRLRRVQLHWSTARYAPWQEGPLVDGLADLVLAGDVEELGLSNLGPQRLLALHGRLARRGVAIRSLQVQGSLLCPEPLLAGGLADRCRDLGVDLLVYSPLALGLLTQVPGHPAAVPQGLRGLLQRRLLPRIQPLLSLMGEIAGHHGVSPAQVAINWCRHHGAVPLVGMRRPSHVDEAVDALGWSLSPQEVDRLTAVSVSLPVRMPANPFQSN
ncbi:aldo/keto reductase [Synechococcus sp. RSCCF101]|uniref:aldo/keto reductase n=1 Tax=Synechococcus sp. RSCCF101 TaxID=2511069 RepID=UPI001248FDBC|nr:aldo/keto reductase [Synechococcus sp. RSCCF101]QEY33444.1 aldo/keto reductase [Synechococcus sp. RSCCF101]